MRTVPLFDRQIIQCALVFDIAFLLKSGSKLDATNNGTNQANEFQIARANFKSKQLYGD